MATADARTSVGGGLDVPAVYDGFISYSHSADDLLAPRLQAGLQRFAKPWWKRRALRIFRDEASLSANPHLWASITEAMDGSDWFVLLLSPDAAQSEWVNREVEWWLEHRDPGRILPVVTDGEFDWGDDDIAASSTAVPISLFGAFADEPRWVDLRFARTEDQLDLNNASFRAAIADIASAIRGIPKDELESEEVRQHRRTRKTVAAAGMALMALTLVAFGAAVVAVDRGNEASDQRAAAEENAAEADAQRELADQQTEIAQELAAEARADALAANAVAQAEANPELALLLAVESLQREAQPVAFSAVHRALQRQRTLFQVAAPPSAAVRETGATGAISPAGDRLVVAGHGPEIEMWEVGTDQPLWTFPTPLEDTVLYSPRFTRDGAEVVTVLSPAGDFDPFRTEEPPLIDRLYVLDAETGQELRSITIPPCAWIALPSPMPAFFDLNSPAAWMTCVGFTEGAGRANPDLLNGDVGLLDPVSGEFTKVRTISTIIALGAPTVDAEGRYLAAASGGPGQVLDTETGDLLFEYDFGVSTLSSSGSHLLARGGGFGLEMWDLAGSELMWTSPRFVTRAWFSLDDQLVYAISPDGSTYVLDAVTGQELHQLTLREKIAVEATMSADNARLATFDSDRNARVWTLAAMRSEGATYRTNSAPREYTPASADVAGGVVAVWGGAARQDETLWETTVIDLNSGETLASVTGGVPALSPDGTRLAYLAVEEVDVTVEDLQGLGEPGRYPRVGPVRIIELTTDALILEFDVPCPAYLLPAEVVPAAGCFPTLGSPRWDLEFSSDGSLLALVGHGNQLLWDANTGETVSRLHNRGGGNAIVFTPDQQHAVLAEDRLRVVNLDTSGFVGSIAVPGGATVTEMVFTPDGSLLVVADSNGDLLLVDATVWQQVEAIRAHRGGVVDAAVNPAGTLIASSGPDGFVRVWRLEDRSLYTEIGFEVAEIANVEFIDDTHLFVTAAAGSEGIVITLEPAELMEVAMARLFRSFTEAECAAFGIEPCRTLEQIRDG